MTNFNKVFSCMAATLAITLAVPGRLAFGLFVLVHFNFLIVITTLLMHCIRFLKLESIRVGILALEIIALTILFKQLLIIFCPVAALTLGFSIYMPSISAVILTIISSKNLQSLKEDVFGKFKEALNVSIFCFIIFFIKDIFGFGTITLPFWKNLLVINLPVLIKNASVSAFLATIPGTLGLTVIMFFLYLKIKEKNNA